MVILSGAQRSRRIPRRYLKGFMAGSLDSARDDRALLPNDLDHAQNNDKNRQPGANLGEKLAVPGLEG